MSNEISKQGIIEQMAADSEVSKTEAERSLDMATKAIRALITNGNSVRVAGLGTFHVSGKPARESRNPRDGSKVQIPARHEVRFRPSADLKRDVGAFQA